MHPNIVMYRSRRTIMCLATHPFAGLHVDRVVSVYVSKRIVRERVARDGTDSVRQFHLRSVWLLQSSLCAVLV